MHHYTTALGQLNRCISDCCDDAEGSVRDGLSPGLAEIADTAQRKVQEAQSQLDPAEGIAAAKEAAFAAAAFMMPVQPAGAATYSGGPPTYISNTLSLSISNIHAALPSTRDVLHIIRASHATDCMACKA